MINNYKFNKFASFFINSKLYIHINIYFCYEMKFSNKIDSMKHTYTKPKKKKNLIVFI